MLSAVQMIADLDAAIAQTGETVTLERTAVDSASGAVTVTEQIECPAHIRAYVPQDLVAGEVQAIRVILSATSLAQTSGSPAVEFGVPGRDDRLLIRGNPSNIEQVQPIYYGGRLVRVNLLCRG